MENINTGVLGPYQQTAYQQAAFWSRQYQNPMDWHDFSGRNFAIVTHRNFTWEASHHDLALPRKEGSIYQTNIMTPFTSHSVVQNNCMFLQLLALVATLSNSSMKPSMTNYNFNLNYCTYLYTRTAILIWYWLPTTDLISKFFIQCSVEKLRPSADIWSMTLQSTMLIASCVDTMMLTSSVSQRIVVFSQSREQALPAFVIHTRHFTFYTVQLMINTLLNFSHCR